MSVADDNYVAGLLAERARHRAAGRDFHVHQVDEQLRLLGRTPPKDRADVPPPPENTAQSRPSHHDNRCDVCGRTFATQRGLSTHARSHR